MTLPPGWTTARIGDLCKLINGRAFKPSDWSKSGLPIVRIQNLNTPTSAYNYCDKAVDPKFLIEPGELLFAWSGTPGTSFGAHIWSGPKAVLNQHIFRVLITERLLDKKFFRFALNQRVATFIEKSHGGVGLGHITKGTFEETEVPIPPLNEQRRIVAKLEAVLDRSRRAKEALDAVPALLERFRQSVLATAFRGDLTRDWREKNPDVEPASRLLERIRVERRRRWEEGELERLRVKGKVPKDDKWKLKYKPPHASDLTAFPKLPHGWCWASLEDLSTKVVDGVHSKPNYVPTGVPFVTVKNLTAGSGLSFEELNFISRADHEEFIKRADPEEGDLLMSKDGTLGVVRAVRTRQSFSIFVSVALIKPVDRQATDYLEQALQSPQVQQQIDGGTGTGLLHIHLRDLRRFAVPLAPAEEQAVITSRLRAAVGGLETVGREATQASERNQVMKRAVIAKAFRGELVPQDPSDEPAFALLERIRASRNQEDHQHSGLVARSTAARQGSREP